MAFVGSAPKHRRTRHGGYSIQRNASRNLSTRCDVLRDFDCQFQSRRRLRARNARLASGAGAFDERRELKLEWLLAFNADSVTPNLLSNAPIDFAALILIIEGEVRVFLENEEFAHALGSYAARIHIWHATIFE